MSQTRTRFSVPKGEDVDETLLLLSCHEPEHQSPTTGVRLTPSSCHVCTTLVIPGMHPSSWPYRTSQEDARRSVRLAEKLGRAMTERYLAEVFSG